MTHDQSLTIFMTLPIRIELPNQLQGGPVNTYLFPKPEPVLVDTGAKVDWSLLQEGLAAHGFSAADLSRVIITHAHVDHFEAASLIAAESDAQIWVSEVAYDWVARPQELWAQRIAFYRGVFLPQTAVPPQMVAIILNYMQTTAATCDPIPANRLVTFPANGQISLSGMDWQVIHTPGHASHQTIFYQPETRRLLSSDMLLQRTPTPVVEHPPNGRQRIPALPQFVNSLALVAGLDVDIVYPGHSEPFRNYREIIQKQQTRIKQRKAECLDWVRQGCDTAVAITGQMYANRPATIMFAGLWMVIGYLDLLLAENAITVQEIDSVLYYSARGSSES
jgi:glyoxylase-like metal-dependent hydrolase (beta-lactamase superfamily II)